MKKGLTYKHAGIPTHWDIVRIKHIANVYSGATPKSNELTFWDGSINWITPADYTSENKYVAKGNRTITEQGLNSCGTKLVPKGSVIVSNRAPIGTVAIAANELCTNQGCKSLIPNDISSDYLYYYLLSANEELNSLGSGTTFLELSTTNLKNLKLPLPPLGEQRAIAAFLDEKTAQLDGAIESVEKSVELLRELRAATISEAVTRGLNAHAPLRDSGVPWIGKVPVGWGINKIKHTCTLAGRIGWQGLTSEEYLNEGPFLITGVDFKNGKINWESCVHISEERWQEASQIQIVEDDLLITKDGTVGKIAMAEGLNYKASLNSGVMVIRNTSKLINKRYLFWTLQSGVFWGWFANVNAGNSTIIHLYQHSFKNMPFLVPPLDEQQEIARYLDEKTAQIDALVSAKQHQVQLLRELRASIIAEAVTGKLGIRE